MKEKIIEALKNVNDPELHKNLVELGMVGAIEIYENNIKITILLTTKKCPLKNTISGDIKRELGKLEGINEIEIIWGEMSKEQKASLINMIHGKKEEESPLKGVKMIAVGSGKGGVGKSTVTAGIALTLAKKGYNVGVIDADILGYSIPQIMGIRYIKPMIIEGGLILPIEKNGVKIISMGNLINKDEIFIWRGPMLANALKQFMHDVYWGDLDFVMIDMPPGTGDIPLSIMQTNPDAEMLIVTTPEQMSSDVSKRLGLMARKVGRKVVGIIENMSYFTCDSCDKKHYLLGKGNTEKISEELELDILGKLPMISLNEDNNDNITYLIESSDEVKIAFESICDNLISTKTVQ